MIGTQVNLRSSPRGRRPAQHHIMHSEGKPLRSFPAGDDHLDPNMALQAILNIFVTDAFSQASGFCLHRRTTEVTNRLAATMLMVCATGSRAIPKTARLFIGKSARYCVDNASNKEREFGHNLGALSEAVGAIRYMRFGTPGTPLRMASLSLRRGAAHRSSLV